MPRSSVPCERAELSIRTIDVFVYYATQARSNMPYQSLNLYDGKVLKTFEDLADAQLEVAVQTADECFAAWRHTSFGERAAVRARVAEFSMQLVHKRHAAPRSLALATTVLAVAALALLGTSRPAIAQEKGMAAAAKDKGPSMPTTDGDAELPHAFFTHMGLPEGVGVYSLRVLGIAAGRDGQNTGDVAFHFETGITPRIGLHIRNDRFRNSDKTEAMFQFAAYVSKNGMNGFAPLIEFEVPTRSGASRVNTLVGFTTSLGASKWAFNQVVHYDPKEDMLDGSVALVLKASRFVFPVLELLGEGGTGVSSAVNVLAGIKVRVRAGINLGVAYQIPVTVRKDFSRQVVVGPDFDWSR